MPDLKIQKVNDGIIFYVKVVPGSSRTSFAGLYDGMLKVKVAVPAQKQKANQALIEFLAKKLSVKKSTLTIISGKTSPIKQIKAISLPPQMLLEKLKLYKTGQ